MKSRWSDTEASSTVSRYAGQCNADVALRVYTSRLLGADPALVLHGGGNTSVKVRERDLFGDEHEVLRVKGSGWDLATIREEGFAPVRMDALLRLARLERLAD